MSDGYRLRSSRPTSFSANCAAKKTRIYSGGDRTLIRCVANSLDIDPIGIKDKCTIVIWVIMRAKSGRTVIPSSGTERRLVEGVNSRPIRCCESNVDARPTRTIIAQPEERLSIPPVTDAMISSNLLGRDFDHGYDSESR
jgi:hypothetical protein